MAAVVFTWTLLFISQSRSRRVFAIQSLFNCICFGVAGCQLGWLFLCVCFPKTLNKENDPIADAAFRSLNPVCITWGIIAIVISFAGPARLANFTPHLVSLISHCKCHTGVDDDESAFDTSDAEEGQLL
eukprot:gnl/TRDRNA2_/TRDRNA2_168026_c3_seq2.p1 gnl/TRDRNA2_/TRDRNA2_168026_c3~~gnl/TRDRNA2_/TRDRNA2_168026_c3_seq2.p1  ORF type:complete len:150 (-),score=12.41 gnl/TRDRNA2_/TRDRNA2_168026_c3_seq2:326-712(-)